MISLLVGFCIALSLAVVALAIYALKLRRSVSQLEGLITGCPFPLGLFSRVSDTNDGTQGMFLIIANDAWLNAHNLPGGWQDYKGKSHISMNPYVAKNRRWRRVHELVSRLGQSFSSTWDDFETVPLVWKAWTAGWGTVAMSALRLDSPSVEALRRGVVVTPPSAIPSSVTPPTADEIQSFGSSVFDGPVDFQDYLRTRTDHRGLG